MKLPKVINSQINGNTARIEIHLPPEEESFRGHFPNTPILPGVVQIDWAIRFANQFLNTTQEVGKDFKVKFNKIISPNKPLVLELVLNNNKLDFTYHTNGEQASSGQIKL